MTDDYKAQSRSDVQVAVMTTLTGLPHNVALMHDTGNYIYSMLDDSYWFEFKAFYDTCNPNKCEGHHLWVTVDEEMREFDRMTGLDVSPDIYGMRVVDDSKVFTILDGSWRDNG